MAYTRSIGIAVELNETVDAIAERAGLITVRTASGRHFEAEAAVHAAGRMPLTEPLNLPAAQVERGKRGGVRVNEFLQSVSNPRVYAAGDVSDSGGPPLTPVAGYEGRVVAFNLLNGNRERADYRGVASTVFTIPPLAMTGLTQAAAHDCTVHEGDSSSWYSSKRTGEECSAYKVLTERGTGKILGAHLLGEASEELINVFALAIRYGLTADQVKATLFAYPSHASNVQYM